MTMASFKFVKEKVEKLTVDCTVFSNLRACHSAFLLFFFFFLKKSFIYFLKILDVRANTYHIVNLSLLMYTTLCWQVVTKVYQDEEELESYIRSDLYGNCNVVE